MRGLWGLNAVLEWAEKELESQVKGANNGDCDGSNGSE